MSDSDSEDITPQQHSGGGDDNGGLPALFWDTMPDNHEEHPDFIALKALEEETPPEERAENFKVGGSGCAAAARATVVVVMMWQQSMVAVNPPPPPTHTPPTATHPTSVCAPPPPPHTHRRQQQGNNKLRVGLKSKNRLLLREAADFYSKGLGVQCGDAVINTALYNNRAHVNSLLGELGGGGGA
jgi:hypothetical protein